MRVALSAERVSVQFKNIIYSFRLDQLLLTGPLFDLLTMAKNQSEALFFVNPFILFNLSGIAFPYEEHAGRFIEEAWPRALSLETEPHRTPALDALFALRAWCQNNDACEAQWNTVLRLQHCFFSLKSQPFHVPIPACLYSVLPIYHTSPKVVAYDMFIHFFYARDIFDDFARTGFLLMSTLFLHYASYEQAENNVLVFPNDELLKHEPRRWQYYDVCLQVYKKMVFWVKEKNMIIRVGNYEKRRKGMQTPLDFFFYFLKDSNLDLDMPDSVFRFARVLWSRFLWRLINQDINPETDPSHIIVIAP